MQQHQGGGSQFGAPPPDMGPFSPAAAAGPLPLSSRPPTTSQPQPQQQQQQHTRPTYEELAAVTGAGAGGFPDDDMLGDAGVGGLGGGGSGAAGNRWPREETLALIRIRSEMDATFRDATLKGPLWEEVSRKLAELGYKRSAKKCKEKFENVHKYYKRTKEGRAGRQDGKSYRFFSQLEALHAAAPQQQLLPPVTGPPPPMYGFAATAAVSAPPPMSTMRPPPGPGPIQPAPISSAAPAPPPVELPQPLPVSLQGFSFSSMSESESDDESEDDDMTAETGGSQDRLGKRKRGGGGKKMMSFFEGLMKQVVERQEEMQQRFLETMEKREAERTAREEAWRRQEVARLNREQEQLSQERAASASRDAAIISFLQRIGGQSVQPPPSAVSMPTPIHVQTPPPARQPRQHQAQAPPPQQQATPQPQPIPAAPLQQQPPQPQNKETTHSEAVTPRSAPPTSGSSSLELVPAAAEHHMETGLGGGGDARESGSASSSRWPKTEVHALIQLRMDLDMRYQETGPKGPLWEEISSGMRQLGYNRSSKRCKEKWENINKYFKKVKESNKKRPEDSKTCPYFHQLEAIYRRKHHGGGGGAATPVPAAAANAIAAAAAPEQQTPNRHEIEGKNINDNDKRNNGGGGPAHVPTSNGEPALTTAAFDLDRGVKKPEDIVRELSEQPPRGFTTDETDSDDMGDDYTDDGEEGEDDGKMQYRIQFQRPNPAGATSTAPPPATAPTTAVPTSAPSSTFLAMVQ